MCHSCVNPAEKFNRRKPMTLYCDNGNASKIYLARQSVSLGNEVILSLDYNIVHSHKLNNYLDLYINL